MSYGDEQYAALDQPQQPRPPVRVIDSTDPTALSAPSLTNVAPTEERTEEGTSDTGGEGKAPVSSGKLKGGFDAREAGRLSGEARRQRAAARTQSVDEARLTTRQRLGLAMSELTLDDMRAIRNGLLEKAKRGDDKAINALARLLDQSFGRATPQGDEGAGDGLEDWEAMTPAQRAVVRAQLLKQVQTDGSPAGIEADPRSDREEDADASTR